MPIKSRKDGSIDDLPLFEVSPLNPLGAEGQFMGLLLGMYVYDSFDGLPSGAALGTKFGLVVGGSAGMTVGVLVGIVVGDLVGPFVGVFVGATVGRFDGNNVGDTGDAVGGEVTGDNVGGKLTGAAVGEAVFGCFDGAFVGDLVGDAVVGRIGDFEGIGVAIGGSVGLALQHARCIPSGVGQQSPKISAQRECAWQLSAGTDAGAAVTIGIVQSISPKLYSIPLLHVKLKFSKRGFSVKSLFMNPQLPSIVFSGSCICRHELSIAVNQ